MKQERDSVESGSLIRAECGEIAENDAEGWRALFLRSLPEDQPEVVVFCPDCAEREFERTTS